MPASSCLLELPHHHHAGASAAAHHNPSNCSHAVLHPAVMHAPAASHAPADAAAAACGGGTHELAPPRAAAPARPALVRWVVHSVLRKPRSQQQLQEQHLYQDSLVSGSSFDSLEGLEQQLACGRNTLALTRHAQQKQQQQQHLQQHLEQQQQEGSEPLGHSDQADGPAPAPAPAGGRLQRCARAVLRPLVRLVCGVARVVAGSAGPQGPGNNDNSRAERIINVLTSLPFFAVGAHGLRHRRSGRGRHFALSFLLVGAAATGYHGAERSCWLRLLMRKLDYYSICVASTLMRRAAHISLPRGVGLAAALASPLKPTLVTGLNLALVEGKFLSAAMTHAHLRPSFGAHLASATVGLGCFAFEDVATGAGWPPVLHSAWHCLSALAMGCVHSLFGHLELGGVC